MSVFIPVPIDEAKLSLISEYATSKHGSNVPDFLIESALNRIQDEMGAEAFREAAERHRKDSEAAMLY